MSKTMLGALLAVFGVILVLGYISVIPDSGDPRPVPTDTPAPQTGGGADDAVAAGAAIYQAQCASCHTTDGSTVVGPTWQGLFESEITLEDGSTVIADAAYIRESILQPAAKVHEGFQPIMPVFQLSDEEIENLIAYIQTLN